MAKINIGIEISEKTLKVIEAELKNDMFQIKKYKIIDFDFIEEEVKELGKKFKEVISDFGLSRESVGITLSLRDNIVRLREFPITDKEKELSEMVHYEAGEFLPYDLEQYVIDYRVIDVIENDEGKFLKVMIAATPLDLAEKVIQLVDNTKLKISVIDVYTNALYNFAREMYLNEKDHYLFVDIGRKTIKMSIFKEDKYFANIHSRKGIDDVVEFLSMQGFEEDSVFERLFEKEMEEIEKVTKKAELIDKKNAPNVSEKLNHLKQELNDLKQNMRANTFNEMLYDSYDIFGDEIKRTLDFYRSRDYESKINKIVLLGKGSRLKNIRNYIEGTFSVQTIIPESRNKVGPYSLLIPPSGAIMR